MWPSSRQRGWKSLLLDLNDSASIRTAVATVLERSGGRLDALFNNAAYGQPGAVEDLSRAALREQFEVNLFGTQELSNQVIPVLRRQGHGRIVYSSVLGLVALPTGAPMLPASSPWKVWRTLCVRNCAAPVFTFA